MALRPRRCGRPVPAQVVTTNNYSPAWPASDSAADVAAADAFDILQNRLFTDPLLLGTVSRPVRVRPRQRRPRCVLDGDLAVISADRRARCELLHAGQAVRAARLADAVPMEQIPGYPVTAFGWPVVPAGLTEMLTGLRERYGEALPPRLHHREWLLAG